MKSLLNFIFLTLSSFGFATAMQMIRGKYFNFKPFNCRFCLSFWFSVIYLISKSLNLIEITTNSLAVACVCYFLNRIDDSLFTNKNIDDILKS